MNSRQQPDNPTDSQATHTATVVQFGSVRGYAQNGNWNFSVTDPLRELGVTPETVLSGTQASFLFAEPEDEMLNGVLKTGDDAIGGRTATNARSVTAPGSSLRLSVPEELLTEAGIHCDIDAGIPPLVEFWAGDGVISIRSPTRRQIAHPENPNTEFYQLPVEVQQDYHAVVIEGRSPEAWAEERERDDPVRYISQNIEMVKRALGEEAEQELRSNPPEEIVDEVFNSDQVILHKTTGYRITLTDVVQNTLPDAPPGGTCLIQYHINRREKTNEVQGELLTDGVDDTEGDGSLIRSFDHRYRTSVPTEVVEALGYDASQADGKPINVYSSEGSQRILLTPPAQETITVTDPEVVPRYNALERYVAAITQAANDVGEPLSIRQYRDWNANQNEEYPSGYTMASSDWKWSELCEEAGVKHGGSE